MRTEDYISSKCLDIDLEKVKIPDFSETEIDLIERFVEFTRHIQELDQLFSIFKINLKNILSSYTLKVDDFIVRNFDFNNTEEDFIIINALVINYISSAKTFIESIETFFTQNLGKEELGKFKENCLSKMYDEKFSYRLLIRLRDYSQHGHLPVFVSSNKKCSFNLDYILYTPNFSHNAKLKAEMMDLKKYINDKFGKNPNISFTRMIAEFNLCFFEVYMSFISTVEAKLDELVNNVKKLIEEKPEIIYKSDDFFDGFIFYYKNEMLNCFNPKEETMQIVIDIKNKIEKEFEEEKYIFDKAFKEKKLDKKCWKGL